MKKILIILTLNVFASVAFAFPKTFNVDYVYPSQNCRNLVNELYVSFEEYRNTHSAKVSFVENLDGAILGEESTGYGSFIRTTCQIWFWDNHENEGSVVFQKGMLREKKRDTNFLDQCKEDLDSFTNKGSFPLVIKTQRSIFNNPTACYAVAVDFIAN